jgi:hypothetical protein
MSDDEEVPDYKTKRLETLARAREVARQNRLAKTADKKEIHDKNITERKNARLIAQKQVKQKQEKQESLEEKEEVVEEKEEEEEEEEEEVVKPIPKPKPKKKKQIIVEESSSESETEEVIIVKKKKKKPPPTRIVYKEPKPEQSIKNIQRNFRDYFTL